MKPGRDEQHSVRKAVKSILLRVMVAHYVPGLAGEHGERVVATFAALHSNLNSACPVVHTWNRLRKWRDA